MKYNPNRHHRRSIRLPEYDYSQAGAYFVTICADRRQCIFGDVVDEQMVLNQYVVIIADRWRKSSVIRHEIELDTWVVMPNHFHGIVMINDGDRVVVRDVVGANGNDVVGANGRSPLRDDLYPSLRMKPKSLSSLIAGFKSTVTKQINILHDAPGTPVWQRNYYGAYKPRPRRARSAPHEHIIRDRRALGKIQQYVINNSHVWQTDQLHPNNPSKW